MPLFLANVIAATVVLTAGALLWFSGTFMVISAIFRIAS